METAENTISEIDPWVSYVSGHGNEVALRISQGLTGRAPSGSRSLADADRRSVDGTDICRPPSDGEFGQGSGTIRTAGALLRREPDMFRLLRNGLRTKVSASHIPFSEPGWVRAPGVPREEPRREPAAQL